MSRPLANFAPIDQAQGLRQLMRGRVMHRASVVGFVSHSKMRGQVTPQIDVLIRIASSLCASGHSVLVVDADRLLIGARVGVRLRYELADWVDGECFLTDIIQLSADGIAVMSAAKAFSRENALQSYDRTTHSAASALFRIVNGQTEEGLSKYDFVFFVASASVLRRLPKQALHTVWLITSTQKSSVFGAAKSAASLAPHMGAKSLCIVYSEAADAHDCETAHVLLTRSIEQLAGASDLIATSLQFAGAIEAKTIDNQSRSQQMIQQIAATLAKCQPMQSSFSAAR
jgi:MinD-like ATPase involved in chromosome partitioning or flagellar assembly